MDTETWNGCGRADCFRCSEEAMFFRFCLPSPPPDLKWVMAIAAAAQAAKVPWSGRRLDEVKADLVAKGVMVVLKEDPMVDNVIPLNQNPIPNGYARLNVTFGGNNGDLNEPILFDLSDVEIRRIASEALAAGTIPGIPAGRSDFSDFVVDRFAATADVPVARVMLRPKTPFGGR